MRGIAGYEARPPTSSPRGHATHRRWDPAYGDYGHGAPIVFVVGWALSADMWEYQVPFFIEHGYRCILSERRGHGRSERPACGYDLDTRVDDLAALLDLLDLRSATLVGHSAGGTEMAHYLGPHGTGRVAAVAFV